MSYATEETTTELTRTASADNGMATMSIGQPSTHRIARSGARPLKFAGSELAMAMSFTPSLPYWYEINLYRTTDSQFVAAIRLFHQSEDVQDTVEAWSFKSLEEALAAIEHYDAASDVQIQMPDAGRDLCAAEIASYALDLRARIEDQRQHYRGLVGEVLFELDAS